MICYYAALNGHLDILKWLKHELKNKFDIQECCSGAIFGHISIFKWAIENGFNLDYKTSYYGIFGGQLEYCNGCMNKQNVGNLNG